MVEGGVRRQVRFPPEPGSVGRARRTVRGVLEEAELHDLVDQAALLVSEIVTNAVLHAATEVELRVAVDAGSVRIEVRDGSTVIPSRRAGGHGATTGRGLELVATLADDWGVEVDASGKTVWALVAPASSDHPPADPVIAETNSEGCYTVRLLGVPVGLLHSTIQYGESVLRELALLAIADELPTSLGTAWQAPQIDLGPLLAKLEAAAGRGERTRDIEVVFRRGSGTAALERLALIEEADRLAQEGELLTTAAIPEVAACRRWMISQVAFQEEGAEPVVWRLPVDLPPVVPPGELSDERVAELDAAVGPTVVADDGNRIIWVNAAAAALLAWEVDQLQGRRLLDIIPPSQREAHLAGFARYLLTGEPRILDTRVRLPALRRDGSTVPCVLTIHAIPLGKRRTGFRATLEPATTAA